LFKKKPAFDLDNYQPLSVKNQLRYVILEKIKSGEDPLPDIDGREEVKEDVIRAVLSGHSPYLVSREGTGKTRLAESLAKLLPKIPKIKGCPYNDDPKWPSYWLCPRCRETKNPAEKYGVEFIEGTERYSRIQGNEYTNEAKILGLKDIQAIAKGESPTDPKVFMGTGVLRGNRGIVLVDELPAIPTKVQVLFHPILQENKIILEEYDWERPVDIFFIATGNPEEFSHVNKIPDPLLDRLELIPMNMPNEEVEKKIMYKEKFRVESDFHHETQSIATKLFKPDLQFLQRNVAVPWWVADVINKTARYTRECPNIDKGASIRGSIKAIDQTYASVEIRNGYIANLKDAYKGLKLTLRGRIKLRPDLLGLGEKPEDSFKKIDEVVEDVMWHATTSVAKVLYESVECEKEKVGEELKFLLSTSLENLTEKLPECPELNKIIKYMEMNIPEQEYNKMERELFYSPQNTDSRILEEYHFSAFELIANTEFYQKIVKPLAKERIFIPKKLGER
jgi:Mg-chelatase subunit ChlI